MTAVKRRNGGPLHGDVMARRVFAECEDNHTLRRVFIVRPLAAASLTEGEHRDEEDAPPRASRKDLITKKQDENAKKQDELQEDELNKVAGGATNEGNAYLKLHK